MVPLFRHLKGDYFSLATLQLKKRRFSIVLSKEKAYYLALFYSGRA
jgi:hypothetical protein